MTIPPTARLASRVILIDDQHRVLFCRGVDPGDGRHFWIMPGGGLNPGETFEDAARREILEETGLAITLGPCIWHRRHEHTWNGRPADQFEKFFVAHIPTPAPISGPAPDPYVTENRWWTLPEIAASAESFAPLRAAALLPPILQGNFPTTPIDCGV